MHISPHVFTFITIEKLAVLMRNLILEPRSWICAYRFIVMRTVLGMIITLLQHMGDRMGVEEYVPKVYDTLFQPCLAAEALMRMLAEEEFRERCSLVPLVTQLFCLFPQQAQIHLVDLRSWALTSQDQDVHVRVETLQKTIWREIRSLCYVPPPSPRAEAMSHELWRQMSDCCVCVVESGSVTFAVLCHRVVLCQQSRYFRTRSSSRMQDAMCRDVLLQDMDAAALGAVLQWMYDEYVPKWGPEMLGVLAMDVLCPSGQSEKRLCTQDWIRVLQVADYLEVDGLVRAILMLFLAIHPGRDKGDMSSFPRTFLDGHPAFAARLVMRAVYLFDLHQHMHFSACALERISCGSFSTNQDILNPSES